MANGKYEPQCGNCRHYVASRPGRRHCSLHDFVMPVFDDYVVCADWRPVHAEAADPFGASLEKGLLYRWSEYSRPRPQSIGGFREVQELLLDRTVSVVENPQRGWAIYLPQWDHAFYPAPGEAWELDLDGVAVPLATEDLPIAVTYTFREDDRSLRMEEREEVQRAALPVGSSKPIIDWIERHHGVAQARRNHERNLANPRFLNKNKPLRLLENIAGWPGRGKYFLKPGLGAPALDRG